MLFLSFFLSVALLSTQATAPPTLPAPEVSPAPALVIGFVGGFVRHDDQVHGPVQLATTIRREFPTGVYVDVFENRRGEQAHAEIIRRLDTDHDRTLSSEEKQSARVILYGDSWGGSEAITLARELRKDGVPVLLLIQVDGVPRVGQNDVLIPDNVAEAVNFYQTTGFLHGTTQIRAADPTRTRILGNYRFDYSAHPIRCDQYPWYDRFFVKAHTEIECDPSVWGRVESLIRSKLQPDADKSAG